MRLLMALLAVLALCGCMQSIKEIGQEPALSTVGYGLGDANPGSQGSEHVPRVRKASFSTWSNRTGDLFTDKLAVHRGDILTVTVSINDRAKLANQSDSRRSVGRGLSGSGDYAVAGVGAESSGNVAVNSNSTFKGDGGTVRSESIRLSVAAVVTRVLGNGNLLVRGSQEVRVNSELRVLRIAGIVRPDDIGPDNTIAYERIAEARISYGGRGHITQVQRPPYGQQILNHILPF